MNYFNNGNNNNDNDGFDNDEDDDNYDEIMGKEDNADVNSNKGGRQFIASCLSGRDFCGYVL